MKITPEISAIRNAYATAKKENDTTEMNRLKAKGMELVDKQKTEGTQKAESSEKDANVVSKNEYGDALEISSPVNGEKAVTGEKTAIKSDDKVVAQTNNDGDSLEISGRG